MRKIKNPWTQLQGYDCFGCCKENPIGVHMEFFEDGDEIVCFWKPETHYQGWVNVLHGGILCTLIDETAAWVVFRKLQTSGVTRHIDIKYAKAVMTTEVEISIRAKLLEQRHNLATIMVSLKNSSGQECVSARVTYFVFDKEKAKEMGFTSCDLEETEETFLNM